MSTRPSLDIACAQVSVCFAAGGFAYASALLWVGVAKGGTCPPSVLCRGKLGLSVAGWKELIPSSPFSADERSEKSADASLHFLY